MEGGFWPIIRRIASPKNSRRKVDNKPSVGAVKEKGEREEVISVGGFDIYPIIILEIWWEKAFPMFMFTISTLRSSGCSQA